MKPETHAQKDARITELKQMVLAQQVKIREANTDTARVEKASCAAQLRCYQLESQRDTLIASLADAQRRLQVLRIKTRPCGYGRGVNEDSDETGWPLTDKAAERLS